MSGNRDRATTTAPPAEVTAPRGVSAPPTGNRGIAQLAAVSQPMVQRDVAADARRTATRGFTAENVRMLLAEMYTTAEGELDRAVRALTAAQWDRMLELVPDGLSDAEGSARIIWARSHDTSVLGMLSRIGATHAQGFMSWLTPNTRRTFTGLLRHTMITSEPRREAMHGLFLGTPDGELFTLLNIFAARFRVRPQGGGDGPQPFNAAGLRRLWNVFASLPEGAVADNPSLRSMERERGGDGSGYYADDSGAIVMSYARLTERLNTVDAAAGHESRGISMGVNNALTGQNVFDGTVRHEVGHAVDNRLHLNAEYCVGAAKTQGGAWNAQPIAGVAEAMVAASGGFINGLAAPLRTRVVHAMQLCVTQRRPDRVDARVRAALATAPHATRAATITSALGDPAVASLKICFADKSPGNPWYRSQDDGGVHLGSRVFQEAYAGEWWSYGANARGWKVSQYQFRSPYEWIAEAYNAYYAPPTRGQVLQGVDLPTRRWFDQHVHAATGTGQMSREKAPPDGNAGPGFS